MVNSDLHYEPCYNVQPTENQQFPPLGITFLGAHLEIGPERVFKSVSNNIYCMFIKPTSEEDVNILGTIQQQDYRLLFDVVVGEMKFVPDKCQFS